MRSILAGEVLVDGRRIDKAGALVEPTSEIEIRGRSPYVSRGGEKLAHALDEFGTSIRGRICIDIGASTGGFTDCLLQRGASRVYAVDVGMGQLDDKLRRDNRVVVMEHTNARGLDPRIFGDKAVPRGGRRRVHLPGEGLARGVRLCSSAAGKPSPS